MQVNRYLKDKAFDHIDHALGRPVDPMAETYRNHYAVNVGSPEVDTMSASPYWRDLGRNGQLYIFAVTIQGREALRNHLRMIGDRNRLYSVVFGDSVTKVVATSRSKARYTKWLELSDCCPDLTFKKFQAEARVRLA